MSLKEGRKGGRKEELELASFVWKSPARARARGRNAPIYSLHETGQQKLTIITQCGTGLVEKKMGFSWTASPFWDQTKLGCFWTPLWVQTKPRIGFSWSPSVGPNQGGLFLDSFVGPDQPKRRRRWAFLGRPCGTDHARPDQTRQIQSRRGRGGLFFDALVEPTTPDQTRQTQSRRGRRWAFLGRPCGTRPRQTRPDQTNPKQTREKVGFSGTPLWNQTRPDQTKSKLGGLYWMVNEWMIEFSLPWMDDFHSSPRK
jgi:hypothetical protein